MLCLKFNLSGNYAFFKNPEINNSTEFSYDHIHKPALLGILGCILGFDGRGKIEKHNGKLEYYEKLKNIKVAIVPKKPQFEGYLQTINNSTGFANKTNGTQNGLTQNIRRRILDSPSWDVYILKDSMNKEIYDRLKDSLEKGKSVYPVYLGNNAYRARINNVDEVKLNDIENIEDVYYINSIFRKDILKEQFNQSYKGVPFHNEMYMPIRLKEDTTYILDYFVYTNLELEVKNLEDIYEYNENYLYFM